MFQLFFNRELERAYSSYPENQLFRIYESLIARGTGGPSVGRRGRWYRVSQQGMTSGLSNHTTIYNLGQSNRSFLCRSSCVLRRSLLPRYGASSSCGWRIAPRQGGQLRIYWVILQLGRDGQRLTSIHLQIKYHVTKMLHIASDLRGFSGTTYAPDNKHEERKWNVRSLYRSD